MRKHSWLSLLFPIFCLIAVFGTGFVFYLYGISRKEAADLSSSDAALRSESGTASEKRTVEGGLQADQSNPKAPSLRYEEEIKVVFSPRPLTFDYLPVQYHFEYTVNFRLTGFLAKAFTSDGITVSYAKEETKTYPWSRKNEDMEDGIAEYSLDYSSPVYTVKPEGNATATFTQTSLFTPSLSLRPSSDEALSFLVQEASQRDSQVVFSDEVTFDCHSLA
jgi:hypothetical protein